MKEINKILLPVDFSESSENAFRYAIAFADKYNASLLLQHIISQDFAVDYAGMVAQVTASMIKKAEVDMESFVEKILTQTEFGFKLSYPPIVNTEICLGGPATTIIEKSALEDVDMIIMGTQGSNSRLDKFFGGVTSYVVKNATCPVLVIPEKASVSKIKNIGFATDLGTADPFYIWEIEKALTPFDADLTVCHIHLEKEKKHPININDLEAFFAERTTQNKVKVCEETAKNIVDGLNEFAYVNNIDLMVLHSPKRSFFERLFHKSTTREMIFGSEVPMLVMR